MIKETLGKYHIITYGCQMNKSDSERIAQVLEKQGYKKAPKAEGADLVVINLCSVRQKPVNKCKNQILRIKTTNQNAKIILTGCILENDKKWFRELGAELKKFKGLARIKPETCFVPITRGCNNFCAYCVVPLTRGREKHRNQKEILCEVQHLVKKGIQEITLLGQNVNSYPNFVKLLQKITALPGNFKIKFITNHPKDFSDELIEETAQNEKIAKYIHLPIQSGDNEILKKMNRHYTRANYLALIKKIKKKIPKVEITTDVIVGFPGETKKQFQNTVDIFKKVKFAQAYIAKYSPRAGTAAYKLKDNVPLEEKKQREQVLRKLLRVRPRSDPKLVVILGPTAAGKTSLSIKLAKKFNGEVVSADSRQVYKGMDIGTGKVTKKEMQGVPHYLLDIASPKRRFSVAQYQKMATEAVNKIIKKGKIPLLVGGSPFYIYSVTEGWQFPEMKADVKLRKRLEKKSREELFKLLKKLAPQRAKTIEKENKRRLIRAVEIAKFLGKVPPLKKNPQFDCLFIGVKKSREELKALIEKRLLKRLREGMIQEVKRIRKSGLSWQRLEDFGLEYRWIARYLQKKINPHTFGRDIKPRSKNLHSLTPPQGEKYSKKGVGINYQEMVEKLQKDIEKFSKRQMTWFKRDKRIKWIKNYQEAEKSLKTFLKNY